MSLTYQILLFIIRVRIVDIVSDRSIAKIRPMATNGKICPTIVLKDEI